MRAETKAELQMLREFAWKHMQKILCRFCGLPLLPPQPGMTFGHRRHPPIKVKITQHHEDFDRSNNDLGNLKDCHRLCHKKFHREVVRQEVFGAQKETKQEGQQ